METSPADNAATRFDKVTFRPPGRVAKAVGFTGSGPSKPAEVAKAAGFTGSGPSKPAEVAKAAGFTGSGPSKPAECEPAQHVDPAVIAEIGGRLQAAPS